MDRQDDRFSEKPEAKVETVGDIAQHRCSIPYSGVEHRSVPIDELAVIRQDASTPFEKVFLERYAIRRRGLLQVNSRFAGIGDLKVPELFRI